MEEPIIQVSVVMPCLNEEKTIGVCIEKALQGLAQLDLPGEVVVSDNGSTDRSVEIAESYGVRVVHQHRKGYGNAYLKGIAEARGQYIVIGDSDDTYDFTHLEPFVTPLQDGSDVVMGNRFTGEIVPGAMPWHHQYIGNPLLSGVLNLFFHTGVGDAHCGMRSFTKHAFERMHLKAGGMEFASEMVINASRAGLKIAEVPVVYRPRPDLADSKLRSFRDGWRHLRFMLLYSPDWLFIVPGSMVMLVGLVLVFGLVFGPVQIAGFRLDTHFEVLGSMLAILGLQTAALGVYAKVYARTHEFDEQQPLIDWLLLHFNLERGTLLGGLVFLTGFAINVCILNRWLTVGFGGQPRLREAILAMTLMVIGAQVVFSAWFLGLLAVEKRGQAIRRARRRREARSAARKANED